MAKNIPKKTEQSCWEFKNILYSRGVTATIRRSKGEEIMAACGQLAAEKRSKEIKK